MKLIGRVFVLCFAIFSSLNASLVCGLTLNTQDNPNSLTIKMLPWEQARQIIPNKSIFKIIDVETGMEFTVQRRAGNKHADVQPLTYEDTKIMKTIYNGKWSWKRRAILIYTDDQLIAASMHGMPHGAGALKNGFPGHFCVHFYGSTTHGSGHEDLSHKIMILRAGGQLQNYLQEIEPIQVVNVLETAINQGDQKTINMILTPHEKPDQLQKKLKEIFLVLFDKKSLKMEVKDDFLIQHIHLQATLYRRDYSKEKKEMDFLLFKDLVSGQWVIDSQFSDEL